MICSDLLYVWQTETGSVPLFSDHQRLPGISPEAMVSREFEKSEGTLPFLHKKKMKKGMCGAGLINRGGTSRKNASR